MSGNLGNKEVMAQNLSFYMKKNGVTRNQLSDDLNISYTTIRDWLKAKTYPRIDKIEMLANYFSISKSDLVEEYQPFTIVSQITETSTKLEPPRQEKVYVFAKNQLDEQEKEDSRNKNITSLEQYKERKQQKKSMSVFDWHGAVSAGTGEFLADEYREEITLPTEIIPDDADFCLTVNGDSMEPIFHDNDYVFVKKQLEVFSGAIGVVILNGQAFLKRIWFENDIARLQSFNSNYDDIIVTQADDFRIIGKVVM